MIYYISFADEEGFRGGVLVDADTFWDIIPTCWRNKCNPGGEAKIVGPIPDIDFVERTPKHVELFRIYSKAEIESWE